MVSVFSPIREMTAEELKRVTEVTYLGVVHGILALFRRRRLRPRSEREHERPPAGLFDFAARRFESIPTARNQAGVRAAFRKLARGGAANASRRAGDDDDFGLIFHRR